MSAAIFILGINLAVAGIFATAFGVVAAYSRSAIGARWLAFAYGLGMINPVLEFILPWQDDPRLVGMGIFAAFLFALGLCVVGLALHYRLTPPWRTLALLIVASLALIVVIIDMPRASFLRGMLYQLPYFALQMLAVVTLLRIPRRQALDLALIILLALSALQFISKPFIAAAIGSGANPQAYISSTYAAISQSVGAVLLVANGLLLLLIIARDAMAEVTARSETDKLSGLLNRRGFEDRADKLLATARRAGVPAAIVVADLDHFKAINDNFGHEAGDQVISAFAQILTSVADRHNSIGRLGGEEFAVFMAGKDLSAAQLYAETVRSGFSALSIASLGPHRRATASFGVAQLEARDSISDLLRRADAALYEAKKGGRDRVCLAERDGAAPTIDRRQGSRRA